MNTIFTTRLPQEMENMQTLSRSYLHTSLPRKTQYQVCLDHGRTLKLSEMQASDIERGTIAIVNRLDQHTVKKHLSSSKWTQHSDTAAGTVEVNILMMANLLLKAKNAEPVVN